MTRISPMRPIPYGRQDISAEDIEAVVNTLKSDWLTQGPLVQEFEKAITEKVDAQYAVSVTSATAALHIGCLALGLTQGDWLWTVPNTFVASANCGLYCGAKVDFVDIEEKTFNICPLALEKKLDKAQKQGCLPKVLVVVHFAGCSTDMKAISLLAQRYHFKVIEDASHAIGGSYQGHKVGSCQFSDLTVFSFHPVKNMTTGEGGALTTNDPLLYKSLSRLRSHGITRDKEDLVEFNSEEPWIYEQQELGFNYRLTDIQCALGLSQLQRLDTFITKRNQFAQRYIQAFANLPLKVQEVPSHVLSAYHLFVITLEDKTKRRLDLFKYLRENRILANVHYIPVHLQPFYQKLGFKKGMYPQSEQYYENCITLPLFSKLSEDDQDYVIEKIQDFF